MSEIKEFMGVGPSKLREWSCEGGKGDDFMAQSFLLPY